MKRYSKAVLYFWGLFLGVWCITLSYTYAQFRPPRTFSTEADVLDGTQRKLQVEWLQAESLRWDHFAKKGSSPFDLSASNQLVVLEVVNTTNQALTYIINTGTLVDAASGWMRFEVTPENSEFCRRFSAINAPKINATGPRTIYTT